MSDTRLERHLAWPRDKRRRLNDRWEQWLAYRIGRYGPGRQHSDEEMLAAHKLQIEINQHNEQYERQA